MKKLGEFPWVFYFPFRGPTAIEMQIGRWCVRWCYLGVFRRHKPMGSLWRRDPFQLCRWSSSWDTSDREEEE